MVIIIYWHSNILSIPVSHSLAPDDPLTVPFVIQNNSIFNLDNISIYIYAIELKGKNGNMSINLNDVLITNAHIIELESNSRSTIVLITNYPYNKWQSYKYKQG